MKKARVLHLTCFALILTACNSTGNDSTGDDVGNKIITGLCDDDPAGYERPAGWTKLSHCPGVAPDYDKLFGDETVHRFDITVSPDNYQATMDDLADNLTGGGPGRGMEGFDRAVDPIFVPVTIDFDGLSWPMVGMRYKGNSSLQSAWQMGVRKLAFRLNFEMYDTEDPRLVNQRFYGFEKMTFSNGFKDPSLMRDKISGRIFREAGVPAAQSAFARVYVDFGEGPVYFGLYTMIEDPSNKMLDTQFADDDGHLYKPEGEGAKLREFVQEHFDEKTGTDTDWRDVKALIDALNAEQSDRLAWRAGLEAVFNVDGFLTALAVNQTIVNWDSYGTMSHNYYLYGDPADNGRLTYFPWDLNEAMLNETRSNSDEVMLDSTTDEWPLIRYLLDDPTYRAAYRQKLAELLEGAFDVESVQSQMEAYHALIAPYVVGKDGESGSYTFLRNEQAFNDSLSTGQDALLPHVETRAAAVQKALKEEGSDPTD